MTLANQQISTCKHLTSSVIDLPVREFGDCAGILLVVETTGLLFLEGEGKDAHPVGSSLTDVSFCTVGCTRSPTCNQQSVMK